ncbi:D-alanyl-D-alanine carboxypeptidase/D-alanyl-D-alanine-endopeptidase [Geminocystis sp. NIES-3709]|uniref:D-alanyl-D-alanine carboxypeptidase/D-alanyl-D-alanine endopeptidase n=1 Tax=Geminocystis sp. NIES-3709 TaxID=1617448 RepID=UPI0005FC8F76|nr:D-alanyl-D-alanine carboxypeptidase/D-alanyl-D-alanine-endopeptidase [Geminocystis sp. NIES-3709]BAQ65630.1 D-alanyl-D-alanine carboxypeptidase [Geminocystis sp. NIES-3709]
MKLYLCLIFSSIFSLISFPITAQESVKLDEKICESNLNQKIESIVNEPSRQQETWGILIENLNNNQVLYQLNKSKFFVPASNLKLLTTAGALLKFGADFRIKTPVYIKNISINDTIRSNSLDSLIIEGKGDPTFSKKQLEIIAQKLQQKGVKQINSLVLIDGYLSSPSTNYTWEFEDIYFYFAVPINSLILENNTVSLTLNPTNINEKSSLKWSDELAGKQWSIENSVYTRDSDIENNINIFPIFARSSLEIIGDLSINEESNTWQLSIPNPAKYFEESLIQVLNNYDIEVKNSQIIDRNNNLDQNRQLFLEINSPTLAELIKVTNQESNNLYAEILLKYLLKDELTEWESLNKMMNDLGVSERDYKLKDGSGLSRHNLITPSALVTILKGINNSKYQNIFANSLSIAGVNGTLENRFKDSNITNNLYGKTGTLTGSASLSGYLKNDNYEDLVFSIIVNNSTASSAVLRSSIDQIILLLGQLKKC